MRMGKDRKKNREDGQHVAPIWAQIFWLKNRKPNEWKDRRDVSVDGTMDTKVSKLDSILKQLKEE